MERLWAALRMADVQQDLLRNIVSIRVSQDLFDDLTNDPAEAALAQLVELQVKPPTYVSPQPVSMAPTRRRPRCTSRPGTGGAA